MGALVCKLARPSARRNSILSMGLLMDEGERCWASRLRLKEGGQGYVKGRPLNGRGRR